MGAGQGPLPAPRPGLIEIANFQDPREGSYLGPWWASYSRIPLNWMKRFCEGSVGWAQPRGDIHPPPEKGKKGLVIQVASHTAPLPQLRAECPGDTEHRVQGLCGRHG